jgi:hypothetical protein
MGRNARQVLMMLARVKKMHALAMKMHTTLMMAWSLAHGCHGGALAYGAYALGDLLLSI